MAHKGLSPGRPNPWNVVQYGFYLPLSPEAPVVFNGKTVGFILNPGDKPEPFGVTVNGNLHIIIVESPGSVVIILHHTADRYGKPQLIKDLQGNVYLSSAAVHHDQVRKPGKTSHA